ncbi:MAG: radical SAM family heme chaperone HemW [Pseudomonadota bacterium]
MRGFGLYVHWPFCQAKCPYCDFNSHVSSDVDHAAWADALCSEIRRCAEEIPDKTLSSVFFGGGTPSLMQAETVARVIDTARAAWPWTNDPEVTLEANPTSVEAENFAAFHDAGVNRVSIGIQALNDADLRALGRLHTADEARQAFDIARSTFRRVSFDLIYARQNQSLSDWEAELKEALNMAADHLSLYQLTIEDGTAFGARHAQGGLAGLPGEDLSADMFELTQTLTAKAGLPAYEVSNHAVPGGESRHNLTYWRSEDWVGVGPGAHGRYSKGNLRIATEALLKPSDWLRAVQLDGTGETSRSVIPSDTYNEEVLMMGLRLEEGLPMERLYEYAYGIRELEKEGLLEVSDGRVKTSPKGKPLLNAIIRALII